MNFKSRFIFFGEDGDSSELAAALGHIAKAKGVPLSAMFGCCLLGNDLAKWP